MSNYHVFHFFNFVTIWITLIFGGLGCLEKKNPNKTGHYPETYSVCQGQSISLTVCAFEIIDMWYLHENIGLTVLGATIVFLTLFLFLRLNKELSCSEVWWMMSQTFSSAVIRTRLIYHSLLNICRLQVFGDVAKFLHQMHFHFLVGNTYLTCYKHNNQLNQAALGRD